MLSENFYSQSHGPIASQELQMISGALKIQAPLRRKSSIVTTLSRAIPSDEPKYSHAKLNLSNTPSRALSNSGLRASRKKMESFNERDQEDSEEVVKIINTSQQERLSPGELNRSESPNFISSSVRKDLLKTKAFDFPEETEHRPDRYGVQKDLSRLFTSEKKKKILESPVQGFIEVKSRNTSQKKRYSQKLI